MYLRRVCGGGVVLLADYSTKSELLSFPSFSFASFLLLFPLLRFLSSFSTFCFSNSLFLFPSSDSILQLVYSFLLVWGSILWGKISSSSRSLDCRTNNKSTPLPSPPPRHQPTRSGFWFPFLLSFVLTLSLISTRRDHCREPLLPSPTPSESFGRLFVAPKFSPLGRCYIGGVYLTCRRPVTTCLSRLSSGPVL